MARRTPEMAVYEKIVEFASRVDFDADRFGYYLGRSSRHVTVVLFKAFLHLLDALASDYDDGDFEDPKTPDYTRVVVYGKRLHDHYESML